MAKAKLKIEIDVDLPISKQEANRMYPDTLWPLEALALDKVSEIGIKEVIAQGSNITTTDVVIYE